MVYSEARGLLTYEKNLKSNFSCQTPFKAKYDLIVPSLYSAFASNQSSLLPIDWHTLNFENICQLADEAIIPELFAYFLLSRTNV